MKEKVIGIDLGSRTTKIVVVVEKKIQDFTIFETGLNPLQEVQKYLQQMPPGKIVATGYGRHLICENFAAQRITEIKACARGVHSLFPACRTILDVGGQDCKVIHLNKNGRVIDFEMNDRCAAGTGKFLEVMAQTFKMDLNIFVETAMQAKSHVVINSMCTVFAESEVISLITSGKAKDEIALGLHFSVINRLYSMINRISPHDQIFFVGGGAKNDCLFTLLEQQLQRKIKRPPEPQIVAAFGAALSAGDSGI